MGGNDEQRGNRGETKQKEKSEAPAMEVKGAVAAANCQQPTSFDQKAAAAAAAAAAAHR